MKKRIFSFLFAITALIVLPFSVYASDQNANKKSSESIEIITNQKIVNEENPNGSTTAIGYVTYEYQPSTFSSKANGCSTGKHLNVVNNGTPETTRIHGKVHPGYCQVKTTTYWRCTNCDTVGHDDSYKLVWCPNSNISGDETGSIPNR